MNKYSTKNKVVEKLYVYSGDIKERSKRDLERDLSKNRLRAGDTYL
jgi:hypothetical protein